MAIVSYIRECEAFIRRASDENITSQERLLYYALLHVFNARAQGNLWPDGFIEVANRTLLSFVPYGESALNEARNRLVQRGYVEYRKGIRHSRTPAYRMRYLCRACDAEDEAPQEFPEYEPDPDFTPEIRGKDRSKERGNHRSNRRGNQRGNKDGNRRNIIPDIDKDTDNTLTFPSSDTHNRSSPSAGARARWFDPGDPDAECDEGWRTGERSRGAIAQRVIEHVIKARQISGAVDGMHEMLCDLMQGGMHPSILVEMAANAGSIRAWSRALLRRGQVMGVELGERAEAYDLMARYGLSLREAQQALRNKAELVGMA